MRNIKSSVCLTCQKRLRGDDYAAEEPFSESTRQPSWCRRTLKTWWRKAGARQTSVTSLNVRQWNKLHRQMADSPSLSLPGRSGYIFRRYSLAKCKLFGWSELLSRQKACWSVCCSLLVLGIHEVLGALSLGIEAKRFFPRSFWACLCSSAACCAAGSVSCLTFVAYCLIGGGAGNKSGDAAGNVNTTPTCSR